MSDEMKRQIINPWKSCRRSIGQMRQLAIETSGKMTPNRVDLLLDQIEIVQQPFCRRRDSAIFFDDERLVVILPKDPFVIAKSRKQPIGALALCDLVRCRQRQAMV